VFYLKNKKKRDGRNTEKKNHPNFERRLLFGRALWQEIRFQSKKKLVIFFHHTFIPAPVVS
jgi:hypothetical protein